MEIIHTLGAPIGSKGSNTSPKLRDSGALGARELLRTASLKTIASTVAPPLLGAALAFSEGFLKWKVFLLICLCSVLIHSIGGMLSKAYETRNIEPGEYIDPERESILNRDLKITAGVLTIVVVGFGLIIALLTSKATLAIGFFSLLFAYLAAGGPFPITISLPGKALVHTLFGVSGAMGAYYALTMHLDWHIALLSVGSGLIAAVLFVATKLDSEPISINANRINSQEELEEAENSKLLGASIIFFYLIVILLALSLSRWSLLIGFVSLPYAVKLLMRSAERAENPNGACGSLANGLLISTTLALGFAFIVF